MPSIMEAADAGIRLVVAITDGIPAQDARDCVDAALAATELPLERERKGETRVDDVRGSIEALAVEETERVVLRARLATVGRGLRPAELISVVFPGRGDPLRSHVGEDEVGRELRDDTTPVPGAGDKVTSQLVGQGEHVL